MDTDFVIPAHAGVIPVRNASGLLSAGNSRTRGGDPKKRELS